ncbi:DUF3347 domain-containing protein [Mucilaginibacter terrae]|uniref:DUF3347 domain-containing protein n=1 Tax=Mucilaginibacter terrae TaxID=1955052 RepID=UPI003625EE21
MKKYLLIAAIAFTAALSACEPSGKQNSNSSQANETTAGLQTDTAKVYNAYLQVKNDLVKTDGNAAKGSAGELAKTLNAIKGCAEATNLAKNMAATNDIKSQRILFLQLSQDVIPLVKGMKSKKETIYIAYCPMADEGKGGYWLSAQKEIKNPYYGDEMLECGEVKEEIK